VNGETSFCQWSVFPAILKENGISFPLAFHSWIFPAFLTQRFFKAVSSCASDATYHVMWIILFSALDDFGIKEINEVARMGNSVSAVPNQLQIDVVKRKVADEALHGALRIAGLVCITLIIITVLSVTRI
jgi:hypothetical protein